MTSIYIVQHWQRTLLEHIAAQQKTSDDISITITLWSEEQMWNVSVLQRAHTSNFIVHTTTVEETKRKINVPNT
jgi:hypothetical protein